MQGAAHVCEPDMAVGAAEPAPEAELVGVPPQVPWAAAASAPGDGGGGAGCGAEGGGGEDTESEEDADYNGAPRPGRESSTPAHPARRPHRAGAAAPRGSPPPFARPEKWLAPHFVAHAQCGMRCSPSRTTAAPWWTPWIWT